jgi:hypothetical protein
VAVAGKSEAAAILVGREGRKDEITSNRIEWSFLDWRE